MQKTGGRQIARQEEEEESEETESDTDSDMDDEACISNPYADRAFGGGIKQRPQYGQDCFGS